jgi:surfeit locus 1 family protein
MITAKPRFGFLLLCAVLAMGCFGLTYWQWQRLDEKTALLAMVQAQTPILFDAAQWQDIAAWPPYQLVTITGQVDQTQPFFRPGAVNPNANAQSAERLGYDLWLPLVVAPGRAVMVNYGWIDADMKQKLLNQSATATKYSNNITGFWVKNITKNYFTPENQPTERYYYWADISELAMITGYDLAPGLVYNQVNWYGGIRPAIAANIPNNHRQYAWTWLLLGLVNVVGGLYYWYRLKTKP